MPNTDPPVYTYQNGEKLFLTKEPNQFIVRKNPEVMAANGFPDAEQVSPHSSRFEAQPSRFESEMARARALAPTHHAYRTAENDEEYLITDRVFLRFTRPLTDDELSEFLAQYALLLMERYDDREVLVRLTDQTGMNPIKLVVLLTEQQKDLVELAEHDLNYRMQTYALELPKDAAYERQWHLHGRAPVGTVDERASARCEEAWRLLDGFGDPNVVVGVTDDGCHLTHGDFNGDDPKKFVGWGYFTSDPGTSTSQLVTDISIGADPARMYQSGANHGTACAGVIAAEEDGALTVGAAPACRLLPIKWESHGASLFIGHSRLRAALDYMADKVDVISNSWGSSPSSYYPTVLLDYVRQLARTGGRRGKGILFLFAAGNENCPIQHKATVDVPYTNGRDNNGKWVGVKTARVFQHSLVGISGVLHIAAVSSGAQRSHYSNYGTGIDLCAPSSNGHMYRRMAVSGLRITTATGAVSQINTSFGGTSSATPLVAGVAALVLSANPDLSALEVASLLKRTASKDLNMTGYSQTLPQPDDPDTSWDVSPIPPFHAGDFVEVAGVTEGTWSPWFGHGRVDAEAAVREALALLDQSTPDVPGNAPLADTVYYGYQRHQLIGDVAHDLLNPNARAVVEELLSQVGAQSLGDVATWADAVKRKSPGPSFDSFANDFLAELRNKANDTWHYVNLPLGVLRYDRELYPEFTRDDDIVQIVQEATRVLLGRSERFSAINALRLVVHLVGDLHQPIHVGCAYLQPIDGPKKAKLVTDPATAAANNLKSDQGGGKLFLPGGKNLHSYWDSDLEGDDHEHTDAAGGDEAEDGAGDAVADVPLGEPFVASEALRERYKQKALAAISARAAQADAAGDVAADVTADQTAEALLALPEKWAFESILAARSAYQSLEITGPKGAKDFKVSWEGKEAYDARNVPIQQERIETASGNLAALLNGIWP